jgi:hypothetical protein
MSSPADNQKMVVIRKIKRNLLQIYRFATQTIWEAETPKKWETAGHIQNHK